MKFSAPQLFALLGTLLLTACNSHPLLGYWAFAELEQAWQIENQGALTVSSSYEDAQCTDGGQALAVEACHQKRQWAMNDTMMLNDTEIEAYQFAVWRVSANVLNGRLDTCSCRSQPLLYYGVLDGGNLLLFDSKDESRNMVDRGTNQGRAD